MISNDENENQIHVAKEKLHDRRLKVVLNELVPSGAKTVANIGCGEGKLLKLMLKGKQFERYLELTCHIEHSTTGYRFATL